VAPAEAARGKKNSICRGRRRPGQNLPLFSPSSFPFIYIQRSALIRLVAQTNTSGFFSVRLIQEQQIS